MTTPPPTTREYEVRARSTDVFGRVQCSARDHHFIIDGPVQNGCPGEAITPSEVFLSAVAACGIELVHVIAKETNVPVTRSSVKITGRFDRTTQKRPDAVVFNHVALDFEIAGTSGAQAAALVEAFKRR